MLERASVAFHPSYLRRVKAIKKRSSIALVFHLLPTLELLMARFVVVEEGRLGTTGSPYTRCRHESGGACGVAAATTCQSRASLPLSVYVDAVVITGLGKAARGESENASPSSPSASREPRARTRSTLEGDACFRTTRKIA